MIPSSEEDTIRAFILPQRRSRWLDSMSSPKKRRMFLDCLNHCRDIDNRFCQDLATTIDIINLLRERGTPETCCLISDSSALDGCEMTLADAVEAVEVAGFGTIICCIPGRLACYIDERGTKRRTLLFRQNPIRDRGK